MKKTNKNQSHKKHRKHVKLGAPPGTLTYTGHRADDEIQYTHYQYNTDQLSKTQSNNLNDFWPKISTDKADWIDANGIHKVEIIQEIGGYFGLNVLQMEDLLNSKMQPKLEFDEKNLIIWLPYISFNDDDLQLTQSACSFVLNKDVLVSLRDTSEYIYKHIDDRLEKNGTRLRTLGTDYLLYALVDLHVDHYFNVSESINEEIVKLEEQLEVLRPKAIAQQITRLRKIIYEFRKTIVPIKELVRQLKRQEAAVQTTDLMPFYNDLEDHAKWVVDNSQAQIDLLSNIFDMYMSNNAQRLNEIMKTLTITGAIFIPLTFIVGVYGMNFENMPELANPNGYKMVWAVMLATATGLLVYMKYRKWF